MGSDGGEFLGPVGCEDGVGHELYGVRFDSRGIEEREVLTGMWTDPW